MGLLYSLSVRLVNFFVFFLIIVLLPGLPPRTTFPFKEFTIKTPKELKGALESNFHLDGAERMLEGRVYGPECLITRDNELYMGIHGGEVIKLTGNHVTHVTKIGQPCEDIIEESRCGRPLGLAFDTLGNNLLIADGYYGLWEVDLATGKKKLLVSPQQELPGKEKSRRAKTFNGLAVDKQGDIYWTDSTSDFGIQDLVFGLLSNPSGRLFKYNRAKNVSEVLLDELFFANGVALSPEEDFVVVAETGALRLMKYYLKGVKAGQSEVFVDGLPGNPDNLTPDAGGIWVPLVVAADSEHPSATVIFSEFPSIRFFLLRMLSIFELPFRYINSVYPNRVAERFIHFIGHGESITPLAPKRTTIVRVDWNGNIVGSLHGFDRSVSGISHVLEFKEHLYLGSPFNRYLARVKLPQVINREPTVKVKNVRVEGMETVEITPRPKVKPTTTTTTPKPATKPTTTTTTTTTPKPTTTTTTPKPTTTTTPKPTTTTTTTTTTKKPTTTTTTQKPSTTTTTAKPAKIKKPETTTQKPEPSTTPRVPPKHPAPVEEHIPADTKPPKRDNLKVINKKGEHVEL